MKGMPTKVVAAALLLVALALAGVVSRYASREPDGLSRVAADHGLSDKAQPHHAAQGPLAGYQARGVDDPGLSKGVAGIAGALVVLTAAGALTYGVRRRSPAEPPETVDHH
jgi:hypothetical protein